MSKKQIRRLRFAARCATRARKRRRRIFSTAVGLVSLGAVTTLVAAPADVFKSPGAIAEGKAPDALEIGAGDGTVSGKTGAYTYSIPIAVPPGRLGVQPSLALTYSSQQPLYGGIAAGWSLDLPVISRDWSRGQYAPERWSSSMAGRELVETTAAEPPIAGWRMFRAQSDMSQARYQLEPSGTWRVLQTDGSVLYFNEPGYVGTQFTDWMPITRRVDPFGNEVRYHWEAVNELGGGPVELRPSLIEYTANDGAGLAPHAQIWFDWAAPEQCGNAANLPIGSRLSYRGGERRISGYAPLDKIRTQVADGAGGFRDVREYDLNYDAQGFSCAAADRTQDSPIRLLASVTESAKSPDGVWSAMPTISFEYGELSGGTSSAINGLPSGVFPLPEGDGGTGSITNPLGDTAESMLLDMDADGLSDVVYAIPPFGKFLPHCLA